MTPIPADRHDQSVNAPPDSMATQQTEPVAVVQARRVSVWTGRYDITAAGHHVATWEKSGSTTGGTLNWDDRRYQVRASLTGGTASLTAPGGRCVATAHDVGRRTWTVEADGSTYEFRRAGPWRLQERLHVNGRRVGSVKRTSILRGDAEADLPGLPMPVQLFALVLVLTMWDATAAW